MRPWVWGKEVTKICPSSHSRGETHQLTLQVIKRWWGNQKPQPTLIASTAATLSHHSFRTYVQQQHRGAGSQLCSEHRGEELRRTAWRRLLWQVLQKFRDPPSPHSFLLMPSPPSPPRANYFVIRNSDKHTWQFQLPVFHVGRGGGKCYLPLLPVPSRQSLHPGGKVQDAHSYQAFKLFHEKTTLCSILASLIGAGVGRHIFKRLLA